MKIGLNALLGNGDREMLEILGQMKWDVLRTDVDVHQSDPQIRELLTSFKDAPCTPLLLVAGGHMDAQGHYLDPGTIAAQASRIVQLGLELGMTSLMLEIGNEPDLADDYYQRHPEHFVQAVTLARDAARRLDPTVTIVSGGISNMNDRGLDYWTQCGPALPADVWIGVHRYPHDSTPQSPHLGDTRAEEWVTFFARETRPIAITEFGYQVAEGLTEQASADCLLWELGFWAVCGVVLACVYQCNDGPTNTAEDRYGIRRYPLTTHDWKPAAHVPERFTEAVTT